MLQNCARFKDVMTERDSTRPSVLHDDILTSLLLFMIIYCKRDESKVEVRGVDSGYEGPNLGQGQKCQYCPLLSV